jgi:hypothetical protein
MLAPQVGPAWGFTMSDNEWTSKYSTKEEFLRMFDNEQEFVDAMFMVIVMSNYGFVPELRDDEGHAEGRATHNEPSY